MGIRKVAIGKRIRWIAIGERIKGWCE